MMDGRNCAGRKISLLNSSSSSSSVGDVVSRSGFGSGAALPRLLPPTQPAAATGNSATRFHHRRSQHPQRTTTTSSTTTTTTTSSPTTGAASYSSSTAPAATSSSSLPASQYQLPPLLTHSHSRTSSSSCTSTPCLSPQTPQLIRSDSSDSRTTFATPSPLTPSYLGFDQQSNSQLRHSSSLQKQVSAQAQPYGQHLHHHHHHHHHLHSSSSSLSGAAAAATATAAKRPSLFDSRSSTDSSLSSNYSADKRVRLSKMDDPAISLYPPIPDATGALISAYPMPSQIMPHLPLQTDLDPIAMSMYRSSNSPASEPSLVSTASVASTANTNTANSISHHHTNSSSSNGHATGAKQPTKKNQYPCPMAKQFNCSDYFTTSGHAARHAKKHTGKKDAFCPECNKAFTRKDNMEQHRRTHQNGRNAGRNTDDKVKKSTKSSTKKTTVVKAQTPLLEAAVEQQLVGNHDAQVLQPQSQPLLPQPHPQQEIPTAPMQTAIDEQIVAAQIQQQQQQAALEASMMPTAAGPYFLNTLDPGPIPALPMPAMTDNSIRPPLFRSNLTSSIDYIPPLIGSLDIDTLNYSYPSPGLSNGLNSLALAASERDRLSEDNKGKSPSSSESATTPQDSSNQPTPSTESP